ncbi:MAG: hypothetical protein FJ271_25925 [Planctomycetes bacterium]|nr:hypothetical protein [Planctomycetota bacterium]
MKFPVFVNGAYRSQSPIADDERTINWYPEPIESDGATTRIALYPTPGSNLWCSVTESAAGRAAFAMNGRCFFVIGTKLVEVYSDKTYTVRGTLEVDLNPATICSNGENADQLFITSGGKGYCYALNTNTLTEVIASGCTMGAMSYSYFQYLDASTSKFYISEPADGLTWDATQVQGRTIGPDPWKALVVSGGQTWLLGEQTSEVWYNGDEDPFPFVPDQSGGLVKVGIAAPFSVCVANDAVTWLATTKEGGLQVMSARGVVPQRISDFALEFALASYGDVSGATGETYRELGHTFYVLSFPSAGITWVYDFATGKWHQRGTWIEENSAYDAWRPTWHAAAFDDGVHLWCDRETGNIYEVNTDYYVDVDDRVLRRVRRSPTLEAEGQWLTHSVLEVVAETGLGLQSGQGSNPQVLLTYSDDGGKTWSNERSESLGAVGQYRRRVQFWKLGGSYRRTYEIVVTDPIPVRVLDGWTNVRAHASNRRQVA